ncbi:hypothetical protein [Actinocorallia longicatena]|uniref:Uncharacterized protein n=1 Tax=Actinocorallia longicatena TaxID=111803 RepID=A0ABP6QD35_9ACTN
MRGADHRWHPDDAEVLAAYLRAVVNVYEPWTESDVVEPQERIRAQYRVGQAREQLARIEDHGQIRGQP